MAYGTGADCHSAAAAGKKFVTANVNGSAIMLAPMTGPSYTGNEGYGHGTPQGAAQTIEIVDVNAQTTLRCIPKLPIVADTRLHPFFSLSVDAITAPVGSKTEAPWTWQVFGDALKVDAAEDLVLWTIDTGAVVYTLTYDWTYGGFGAPSKAFCPTLSHDRKTLILLQPREISEPGVPFVNHINMVFDIEGPTAPSIDYWQYSSPTDEFDYWAPVADWGAATAGFVGTSLAVVTARPTMTGVDPALPAEMRVKVFDPPYTAVAADLDLELTVTASGVPLPIAGSFDGLRLLVGVNDGAGGPITGLAVFEAPYADDDVPVGIITRTGYHIDNPACVAYTRDWSNTGDLFVVWTKDSDSTSWMWHLYANDDPLTAPGTFSALGLATDPVDYMTFDGTADAVYISRASTVQLFTRAGGWTGGAEWANPGASVPGVHGGYSMVSGALTVGFTAGPPSLVGGVRQRTLTITWTYDGADDLPEATLVFPIPYGLTFVSATAGGTLEAGPPAKVVWDLGPLVTTDTGTVTVTVSY